MNKTKVYEGVVDDSVNIEEEEAKADGREYLPLTDSHKAPFIYAAQFNNRFDSIFAAGAGSNEVRQFDYDTGEVLSVINDVPQAVLCMTKANHSSDFAFGSADHKCRIFEQKMVVPSVNHEEE